MGFPNPNAKFRDELAAVADTIQEEITALTDLEHAKALLARRGILGVLVSSEEYANFARTILFDAFKAALSKEDIIRVEAALVNVCDKCSRESEKVIQDAGQRIVSLRTCSALDEEEAIDSTCACTRIVE